MLSVIRKLPLLGVPAIVGLTPVLSWAQEVADGEGFDLSSAISQGTHTFRDAIHGDHAAQMTILREYLATALAVCAAVVISYTVASAIGRVVGKVVSERVDLTLGKFLTKAVRNTLMIIVAMMVLPYFGINIAGFAAILAAAGFAIGMALQGTLGNFAAGVMLLMFRPFKVDDYIAVAGTEGTVEEIDLFTTRLNALDNRHLIIPNGEIFGSLLENYSRNQTRRVDVSVGAAYSADLDATRNALEKAVQQTQMQTAASHEGGQVYLTGLGASSVDWQLRAWCRPEDYWDVREQLTVSAKQQLDAAGISIPFPQMDVNVVGKMITRSQAA
jgi:small conductance mechanosensitive channel